jgi:hypothetical protein
VVSGKRQRSSGLSFAGHASFRRKPHFSHSREIPITGPSLLPHSSFTQQNRLVDDLLASDAARQAAVQGSTHDNHARAWLRWRTYCESVGLADDIYLTSFNKQQQARIIGAFGHSLREGRYSRGPPNTMAASSIKGTINNVVAAFRREGRPNPTRDSDGQLAWILARQYRAYKNDDPKEKHEKALPSCILLRISLNQTSETKRAISQLIIGAFFFACRSCEYLKVSKASDKRTKQLTLGNVAFFKDGKVLHHTAQASLLHHADSVSITFETQKNERKFDTITQWRTSHNVLCPVKQWAAIVTRISSYEGTNNSTPVSTVLRHNTLDNITAKEIILSLQDAVVAHGEDDLRIHRSEIGTHSIRSGAAMAMYLGGVPVFAIMMIGRWSSDAFMKYIRKQIEEFTFDVSARMLTMQHFRHVPNHPFGSNQSTQYGGSASLMISDESGEGIIHPADQGSGEGQTSY